MKSRRLIAFPQKLRMGNVLVKTSINELAPTGRFAVINVRFGSIADIAQRSQHVRFTPIADMKWPIADIVQPKSVVLRARLVI
jgi:hypothetical protein